MTRFVLVFSALVFSALVLGSLAASAQPGDDMDCDFARKDLREELARRFDSPDDPGLYERRKRLRALFARLSPGCAERIHAELAGEEVVANDDLAKQFEYQLSTPTRKELLGILKFSFAGIRELEKATLGLSDATEQADLECWLGRLRGSTDDRVIEWKRICPQGEAGCPAREEPRDDRMAEKLKTAGDLEDRNDELGGLFTFVRNVAELASLSSPADLEPLRETRRGTLKALAELDDRKASGAIAPHLAAIREWLQVARRNADSVLNCL